MRIGMILDNDFPPDPRVENEADSLIKNGHEVILFALNFTDQPSVENIKLIDVRRFNTSKFLYKKLSALAYTFPFYHIYMKKRLKRFISENNLDAIYIHDMVIAKAVFEVNNNFNLPIVLDLHENRPEIMKLYSHVNSGMGKYLINLNKWRKEQGKLIEKADKVVVVTEEAKNDFAKLNDALNKKIIVVPNTTRAEFYTNYETDETIINKYKDNFVLLYVGDTSVRRGLDTAIEAIAKLNGKIENLKLVVLGSSRDDEFLNELAIKNNIQDLVDFKGWTDFNLFQTYILASNICISPIKRNRHHDTTYANKVFQYMSLGRPILVSDCPAQENLVKETNCGLIHKANDPEDMKEKILELYSNKELRNQLSENGQKAVLKKYNWECSSTQLIELYNKLELC